MTISHSSLFLACWFPTCTKSILSKFTSGFNHDWFVINIIHYFLVVLARGIACYCILMFKVNKWLTSTAVCPIVAYEMDWVTGSFWKHSCRVLLTSSVLSYCCENCLSCDEKYHWLPLSSESWRYLYSLIQSCSLHVCFCALCIEIQVTKHVVENVLNSFLVIISGIPWFLRKLFNTFFYQVFIFLSNCAVS